mgnify:CR=1 FL=1
MEGALHPHRAGFSHVRGLGPAGPRRPRRCRRCACGLTRRELEILRHVATGATNHEVARSLWLSDQTVKFHLANVYRRLDVHSRDEAARWASEHDLLDPSRDPRFELVDAGRRVSRA